MKLPNKNYAFVDGSFNPEKKMYGCGGFLIDQIGKKHIIQDHGSDPELVKMRNVAGELLGAKTAIMLALELGMKKLTIFHDYDGVGNWPTGKWKAKNKNTKNYVEFVTAAISAGLKIYFKHVKGHAGILENEEADQLAKESVGLLKNGKCNI